MNKKNNILILLDNSYFLYFVLFGAVSIFQKRYPNEARQLIRNPEEVDQHNLPNLLINENFKKVLKNNVMKRLETIDWLTKANFQEDVDIADRIDILFAVDDNIMNSFRKELYPEYKAQRVLTPKSFNIAAIKRYIVDVLFKELQLEEKYNYHMLQVEGAEGDDVIACVANNFHDDYFKTIIYASDKDFLQLDDVEQLNLFGKKAERKVGDQTVSADEYLLCKVILGDGADNINKVFERVGPKKALRLAKDKESLMKMLKENQAAAKQFMLNKKLISFKEIPKELESKIVEKARTILYENEVLNKEVDFKDFMMAI